MKQLHELNLSDDFLFAKVMEDPEVCRRILEKILGVEIRRVENLTLQKDISLDPSAKGVRLDVYLADERRTVYAVEMQTKKRQEHHIPKRSRYYQGVMDLDQLTKGTDYTGLGRNVVIFLCTFDSYQLGRWRYTFENRCLEEPGLPFGDETLKVVLNTKGSGDDLDREAAEFLKYVEHSTEDAAEEAEGSLVKLVHRRVKAIKESKEREVEYMKLLERYKEEREEGYKEGLEQGRQDGLVQGLEQGLERGREEIVIDLFQEGSLSAEKAAKKLGLETDAFLNLVRKQGKGI